MLFVFLAGAGLALFLRDWLYSRIWSKALSMRVFFSQPHICVGQTGELTEEIENRKKQSVPVVEIGFRIPMGLEFTDAENIQESDYIYKRDLFAMEGMERIVRRYHVEARRRGYYRPDQLSIHAPSFLFRYEYRMDPSSPVQGDGMYVYARQVDCSLILKVLDSVLGEKESARRLYEDPFIFASIRQYTPQDPMKTVNWKATARTGDLMVNTYASVTSLQIRIFLDVSADQNIAFSEELRELSVGAAASLARGLVSRDESVSFLINVPDGPDGRFTEFKIGRGSDALTKMEEFLTADFSRMEVTPFPDMVAQTADRESGRGADEVCVFFSEFDTPSLRESIKRLLGRQGSGILVAAVRSAQNRAIERDGELLILPFADTE